MDWQKANEVEIDEDAYYVVQTNGAEWRDFDLMVMRGTLVKLRIEPHYIRGRPMWICKVIRPEE